jgi:hypothetical protein
MAGSPGLTIEYRQLKQVVQGLRAAARFAVASRLTQAGTLVLLDALKAEAPARSGRLRASIVTKATGPGAIGFFSVAYSALVVRGTRPHLILARTRRALFWAGAGHPVRRVNHPGTRPNPFPQRAVAQAVPALRIMLIGEGRQIIQRIAGAAR